MGYWTERINACAKETFHYTALLPVQLLIIHNIMEALYPRSLAEPGYEDEIRDSYHNQLVILPTGTGKSACFQIPAVLSDGITLIIYPLLSLINDQLRRMNDVGLRTYKLIGGMHQRELSELKTSLEQSSCDCILTNPETLNTPRAMNMLLEYHPTLVVVDEAHCISKWGKTFRPSYLDIGQHIQTLQPSVTVACTATASDNVIVDIKKSLFCDDYVYVMRGHTDRENITYSVLHYYDKYTALIDLFSQNTDGLLITRPKTTLPLGMYHVYDGTCPVEKPAIIFCSSRSDCSTLALMLRDTLHDENIYFYHAGLSKQEKHTIEEWFLRSNNGILVATCAYGMGVDKANIRTVIHFDPYTDVENFLQEVGRAGRDRKPSISVMLSPLKQDMQIYSNCIMRKANKKSIPKTSQCRRAHLMEAMGMECEGCSGCDVCVGIAPVVPWDYVYILDLLRAYPRCFSELELCDFAIHDLYKQGILNTRETITIRERLQLMLYIMKKNNQIKEGTFFWKPKLRLNKQYP